MAPHHLSSRSQAIRFSALAFAGTTVLCVSCSRPPTESHTPAAAAQQIKTRRSVAVLGFTNRSGLAGTAWLSTALSEMITRELADGELVRTISGESVARMRMDLSISDVERVTAEVLPRVRANLGTDLVILGSYSAEGQGPATRINLDLRLHEASSGATLATLSESGTVGGLGEIATRVVRQLQPSLGGQSTAAPIPRSSQAPPAGANVEATRLQAEGLSRLRSFDPAGAKDLLEKAVAADPSSPRAHAALAAAWTALGYDMKAKEEAKEASDHSAGLSREERLRIEGRYNEAFKQWDKAIAAYRTLFEHFPDSVDDGLRLAEVLSATGKGKEALAVVENLRLLAKPASEDPRIDLAEATAAHSLSDYRRTQAAAARAAEKGAAGGARLLVAQARFQEGRAAARGGDVAKAIASCEAAKRVFAEMGDRAGLARSLNLLANVLSDQGDLARARASYEEALATYRSLGNRAGTAAALNNLAVVLYQEGDLASALDMYQQSLAIFREVGDRRNAAVNLNNIGEILQQQGDLAGARKMFEQSLATRRETGDKWGIAGSLNSIGRVMRLGGDLAGAQRMYQEAISLSTEIGSKSRHADALCDLGHIHAARGDFAAARKSFEDAMGMRNGLGEKGGVAEAWLAVAALSLDEGRPTAAEASARQAASEFEEEKRQNDVASAYAVLARSLVAQGKSSDAQAAIDKALKISSKSRNVELRLTVEIAAAYARAAVGRQTEASMRLQDAHAAAAKAGLVGLDLEARLLLGELDLRAGNKVAGRQSLAAVRTDAAKLGFTQISARAKQIP